MKKLKKLSLLFLSVVLCVAMYGCAGGNSSTSDSQESVRAELAEAINQYLKKTFEHFAETQEFSDPSLVKAFGYDDSRKSFKVEGNRIYEIKTDSNDNATDFRYCKYSEKRTIFFNDGSTRISNDYFPGDGFLYGEYFDGEKTKGEFPENFRSINYNILAINRVENVTLVNDASSKTFNFDFKKDLFLTYHSDLFLFVGLESNLVLDTFNGLLTINKNDGSITFTESIIYKDKNTGAICKYTYDSKRSNQVDELNFPSDLNDYKQK